MSVVKIHFLGTGNAFGVDGRLQASSILEAAGRRILVDAGPAVLTGLERAGIEVCSLDAIFLTHLHGDHIAGMPFIRIKRKFLCRGEPPPLRVYGPTGTRERLELLWRAAYPEVKEPEPFDVIEIDRRRQTVEWDGQRIEVVPMVHLPHSIGYRFLLGGKGVAFSGDTDFQKCVYELCEGMDAAVLECSTIDEADYAHTSLAEVRAGRDGLGCRLLILNHMDETVRAAGLAEPLAGTFLAQDGDVVEIP